MPEYLPFVPLPQPVGLFAGQVTFLAFASEPPSDLQVSVIVSLLSADIRTPKSASSNLLAFRQIPHLLREQLLSFLPSSAMLPGPSATQVALNTRPFSLTFPSHTARSCVSLHFLFIHAESPIS